MRIRPAVHADLARLQHLHDERLALLALGGWRISRVELELDGRDAGGLLVGEIDGVVGGYVSARRTSAGLVIDQMALDAHTYYPGLARALVAAVRDAARDDGMSLILVRVPLFHPVEQAFWRALGAADAQRRLSPKYQWMQLRV